MLKMPLYALRPESVVSPTADAPRERVVDRSIGGFIRKLRNLDNAQIDQILRHQRERNLRFG